ncbi:MAG: hypothetical protein M1828_006432 [Chrysothrix sp. TS-e1954]|nr:MAG: hypothetical protein M1828_006432 [Chrysothrix sp. TS-e1954]
MTTLGSLSTETTLGVNPRNHLVAYKLATNHHQQPLRPLQIHIPISSQQQPTHHQMTPPPTPQTTTNPIPPHRFALALESLPLPTLHSKAAELLNSIAHLIDSNRQLRLEVADPDCAEALAENEVTVRRMRERVGLVRVEVERRGGRWGFGEVEAEIGRLEGEMGGVEDGDLVGGGDARGEGVERGDGGAASGRLTDEELRRRMEERMQDEEQGDEDGMHL